MRTSKRDSILQAALHVVETDGVTAVTYESVAAASGLTKGGLLYHFPSKDHLAGAVCERLETLAAEDALQMRVAEEGPARYYVRSSHYAGTPLDRILVAASRLRQAGDARARAAIESAAAEWLSILHEAIGDLDTARAVKLIGDGLYYNALHRALGGHLVASDADEDLLSVIAG